MQLVLIIANIVTNVFSREVACQPAVLSKLVVGGAKLILQGDGYFIHDVDRIETYQCGTQQRKETRLTLAVRFEVSSEGLAQARPNYGPHK